MTHHPILFSPPMTLALLEGANPLVWAYTFTVARGNIDQIGGAA